MVGIQAIQPGLSLGTEQVLLRRLSQCEEGLEVAVANHGPFSAFLETFAGELADRLEHQETRLVELGDAPQQALVRQLIERIDDIPADVVRGTTDRFDLFQVATPGKNREAGDQAPGAVSETVVAPEDAVASGRVGSLTVP